MLLMDLFESLFVHSDAIESWLIIFVPLSLTASCGEVLDTITHHIDVCVGYIGYDVKDWTKDL